MYDELVKRLRELQAITEHCDEQSCDECENRELCDKHDNKSLSGTYKEAADAIEDLSKEMKTGEWCADYDGYSDGEPVYDMWWCSACGEYFDEWDDRPTWNFCPNCGADMRPEPPKEE